MFTTFWDVETFLKIQLFCACFHCRLKNMQNILVFFIYLFENVVIKTMTLFHNFRPKCLATSEGALQEIPRTE